MRYEMKRNNLLVRKPHTGPAMCCLCRAKLNVHWHKHPMCLGVCKGGEFLDRLGDYQPVRKLYKLPKIGAGIQIM
jgi:hypothetical protein